MRRLASCILAIAFFCLLLTNVVSATAAGAAEAEDEATFVSLINGLRSGLGLEPLAVDTELVAASRDWAIQLRSNGTLSHASDLSIGVTSAWAKLGENVGVADDDQVQELFDAFVQSPGHYANLVDPLFTHLGTAVVYDTNGRMWTTHRFMAKVETTSTSSSTSVPPTTLVDTTSTTDPATTEPTSPQTTTATATSTTGSPTSSTTLSQADATTTTTEQEPETPTTLPELNEPSAHAPLQVIPTVPLDQELLAELFTSLNS